MKYATIMIATYYLAILTILFGGFYAVVIMDKTAWYWALAILICSMIGTPHASEKSK